MDTYKTLDQARAAKGQIAQCILEIEHQTAGICFIGSKAPMSLMQAALKAKPMAEIIRVIAEHDHRDEAQIASDNARMEAEADAHRKCERCGEHVGHDAYRQTENSRYGKVTTYYCDSCRQLLTQIGAGEHTAMQDRASDRPDNTPYTKED
jgi:hypothetical protein